jgi:hypothetical protein
MTVAAINTDKREADDRMNARDSTVVRGLRVLVDMDRMVPGEMSVPILSTDRPMTTAPAAPPIVTRYDLYELVWNEPMTKVAPRFGLSDVGLAKLCKRYDIPRPPGGYWAQKQFGKQPDRTPLPPLEDESLQLIRFSVAEEETPAPASTAANRVTDEQLKRLIQFEEQPENRIIASESSSRFHPLVSQIRGTFSKAYSSRQELHSPKYSAGDACLDIHVAEKSVARALRFMDTFLKAFEERGHKVISEGKDHRKEVLFVILGEKFSFRLREKTKMVRIPESERKKDYYGSRTNYEPTGLFELQLWRTQTGMAEATWKDGARSKLEDQLNAIMIGLIVAVDTERRWRQRQEDADRQHQEDEQKRRQQAQEQLKQEQKINGLNQMVQNWDQAARIRAFIVDIQSTNEQRGRSIEEGSDLAKWMDWALAHADAIDPLGAQRTARPAETIENSRPRPSQPR